MLHDFEFDELLNVNNYYIKKLIAKSPFSNVFLAYDKNAKKEIIIKLFEIPKDRTESFIQTVRTLKILNLSGVCKIYNFAKIYNKKEISSYFNINLNENNDINYIIVTEELMINGNIESIMKEYLQNDGKCQSIMNPTIRSKIIFGVAMIMKVLHSNNFLHQNLTAYHILLNDKYEPKISFSCFSNFLKENHQINHSILQSPFYMAPEIILKREFSFSIDVYSYSILLYRMFSNNFKFSDGFALNRYNFLNRISEGERLKKHQNIPNVFWELIQKCWCQEPDKRPTFCDIVNELKNDKFALDEFGMKTDLNELHNYQQQLFKEEIDYIPEKFSLSMSCLINKNY